MLIEIGHVEAIFRYPVKSMGGERLEEANLGWYGLDGDRRLAFRRMGNRSGMPWLTASKLPDLLLFAPHRREDGAGIANKVEATPATGPGSCHNSIREIGYSRRIRRVSA